MSRPRNNQFRKIRKILQITMSDPTTEPNDCAFPIEKTVERGLNKREHFAAMAMQGLLSRNDYGRNETLIAGEAVACADELIRILNLRQQ